MTTPSPPAPNHRPNPNLRPPPSPGNAPLDIRAKVAADPSGWQLTASGRAVFCYALAASDIDPADLAHHLALQNRFAGATREPYPVAQHCTLCSVRAERRAREEGLPPVEVLYVALAAHLHDGGEYVVVDSPRPVKRRLEPAYGAIETQAHEAVADAFGLPVGYLRHPLVLEADEAILAAEFRDLLPPPPFCIELPAPDPEPIIFWTWRIARDAYLRRLYDLTGRLTALRAENPEE